MKIFVYGTLMGNLPNTFVSKDAVSGYTLYDLGWFPGAVESEGGRIVGELWGGVTDTDLARLDRYEGTPTLYRREKVTLESGEEAWMYVFNQSIEGCDHAGECWTTHRGAQ